MEKGQCSSLETVDRISNLPDPIRSHIMSFLPLQDAVRNTILSRGWKHICSSLTHLDFVPIRYREDLTDIIYDTLFLHAGQYIHTFSLSYHMSTDPLHLKKWISFVLRHNVVELILRIRGGDIGMLPCSLFNSSTLVMLELDQLDLKLPTRLHFPLLKTLKLRGIVFHDKHLTGQLFSDCCCPKLLNLWISSCCMFDFTTLGIYSTSLDNLTLLDYNDRDPDHEYDDDDDDDVLNIHLSTPNLHEISFYGEKLPRVSYETLPSLFIATFELHGSYIASGFMVNLAFTTLAGLHNVDTLRLREYFMDVLTRTKDWSASLLTSCRGLKRLELEIQPTQRNVQSITSILGHHADLQSLFIVFDYLPLQAVDVVPQRLPSMDHHPQSEVLSTQYINLRTVKVENFQGSGNELHFIACLLDKANKLERLDIQFSYCEREEVERRMRISEMLLTFTRSSPHARIFIS